MSRYQGNINYKNGGKPHWQFDPRSNAKLPSKLKCWKCNKVKDQHQFSDGTLGKARGIANNDPRINLQHTAKIICAFCTIGNREELKCSSCGETKAKEEFSNTQRKQKDQARCLICVFEDQAAPPLGQEYDEAPESDDDLDDIDNEARGAALEQGVARLGLDENTATSDGWFQQPSRGFQSASSSKRSGTVTNASSRGSTVSSSISSNATMNSGWWAKPAKAGSGSIVGDSVADKSKPGSKFAKPFNPNTAPSKLQMSKNTESSGDDDSSASEAEY